MSNKPGRVYLVGGGPGDPGLLSLKGLECLKRADFVLYDGLVNPLLLRHTHAQAERTARADASGKRILQQEEINARLIAEAKLGKTVVRLKGGDPYIFGRGSEEAAALAAEGIEFEVVPGITAATAAAEYAGFSLTHRDHASAVCLITGHEDPTKPSSALNYELLAQFPGTLVFYMGLHRLPEIAQALISHGLSAETPGAIITKASTPGQRVVIDTLGHLPQRVLEEELTPPSLIIIGECVTLRERLCWFDNKPLFGKRIGITRPLEQAEPQILQLIEAGAEPVMMPLLEIVPAADPQPLDRALDQLADYQWIIFTSANGVQHFLRRLWDRGSDFRALAQTRLACIGSATAAALEEFHLRADLVPDSYCSESLAEHLLAEKITGKVLWARANRGRDVIPDQLRASGIRLEEVVVYEHRDQPQLPAAAARPLEAGQLDWVALSSPAIARQFAQILRPAQKEQIGKATKIAAISPITAQAATESGLPVEAIAQEFTWDGLFQAIQSWEAAHRSVIE